jgi:hypothetical protein
MEDYVAKNLNAFNTIGTHLISFGVKMDEEDQCMIFFFICRIH